VDIDRAHALHAAAATTMPSEDPMKTLTAMVLTTALTTLATSLGACADEERDNLIEPAVVDGKADASDRVHTLGAIGFGAPGAVAGAFVEDLEWHGYTFAVRPDALVSLEVTQKGSSRSLDTTLYLYGPKNAQGGYGSTATAFDDDAGWGRLSRLKKQQLAGGEWLLVVGTRNGRGRGAYRIEATCESGECAPVVVPTGSCHPAIAAGIQSCVAGWLADSDFDPSTRSREDLISECADVEPMAAVRDRLCDSGDASAEALCALDIETFGLQYLAGCRAEAIGAYLDGACVFGERYRDLGDRAEAIVVLGERRLTASSPLSALEVEQIVAAVKATAYDDADTIDEAFAAVDDNEVNQQDLWDASNRKAYTVYEVGAGDNSFGMIFAYGTTTRVARNNDGDWYDCKVTWGPERRRCTADAQCEGGARCVGTSEAAPMGRCIAAALDTNPNEGSDCTLTTSGANASTCAGGAGLVCAGAGLDGSGMCLPAWMRGAFASEPALAIPDNRATGASAQLLAYGLATVDMDVKLTLFIAHPRMKDLRVTLTNPAGNEVLVYDGATAPAATEIYLRNKPLTGFSGDESVNGAWTLKAVDSKSGQAGTIERFALEITSRWD